jgi:hypothetical protein
MSASPLSFLAPVLIVAAASVPSFGSASLRPEAVAGWNAYVAATQQRIAQELAEAKPGRFLTQDFLPESAGLRRRVLAGEVVIAEMQTVDASGSDVDVPAASVHHWRGAVLIPGAKLDEVLARLRADVPPQEDVLRSAVLGRGPNWMRVYLRLQRSSIVTAVYNSEHLVTFTRQDAKHASSSSASTRIAEVEHAGTSTERELVPGQDRGFLWRLNSYWRYEEVPQGVIAECESLTLSRDVPVVVRLLASPIINGIARESMERTLTSLRAYLGPTAAPRGSSPVR